MTIGMQVALFGVINGDLARAQPPGPVEVVLDVVAMGQLGKADAHELLLAVTQQRTQRRVDVRPAAALERREAHPDRRLRERAAKQRLSVNHSELPAVVDHPTAIDRSRQSLDHPPERPRLSRCTAR